MSHMQPEIIYGEWYEIDGDCGTEFVPADIVGDLPDGGHDRWGAPPPKLADYLESRRIVSWQRIAGYGARMSAPGYLDCTAWAVYETEEEAEDNLQEMYGND